MIETLAVRVALIVQERRILAGISQQSLADTAGIGSKALSAYETGRVAVPLRKLERIAAALKCSVAEVVAEAEAWR